VFIYMYVYKRTDIRGNACSNKHMAGKCKNMRPRRCGDRNYVEVIQAPEPCVTSVVWYRLATPKYFRILTHDRGLNPEFGTDSTIVSCTLIKNPQDNLSDQYSLCVMGV
jgi:hypothetical protein